MPRPNTLAGMIAGVASLPGSPDSTLTSTGPEAQGSWRVAFESGEGAVLPSDANPLDHDALELMRAQRRPAYVTVSDGLITSVDFGIVGRVSRAEAQVDGRLAVEIDASPLPFTVSAGEDNSSIREFLSRAHADRQVVMVRAPQRGLIVDADAAPEEAWPLAPAFGPDGARPVGSIVVAALSKAGRDDAFRRVREHDKRAGPVHPCIPYDYPDTGCDARAHRMFEVLRDEGIVAGKVWVFDGPQTRTPNFPGCDIAWVWHVAIFVRADGERNGDVHVIDPSLHSRELTLSGFLAGLQSTRARVLFSVGAFYKVDRDGRGVRPSASQCENDLAQYRLEAARRPSQPPYGRC